MKKFYFYQKIHISRNLRLVQYGLKVTLQKLLVYSIKISYECDPTLLWGMYAQCRRSGLLEPTKSLHHKIETSKTLQCALCFEICVSVLFMLIHPIACLNLLLVWHDVINNAFAFNCRFPLQCTVLQFKVTELYYFAVSLFQQNNKVLSPRIAVQNFL